MLRAPERACPIVWGSKRPVILLLLSPKAKANDGVNKLRSHWSWASDDEALKKGAGTNATSASAGPLVPAVADKHRYGETGKAKSAAVKLTVSYVP